MIMERVGGLRSGVPTPEEWSVLFYLGQVLLDSKLANE